VLGFLFGDEACDDSVCAHGGGLNSSPTMAEASEVCCSYHMRLKEEGFCGPGVDAEAAQRFDRGGRYCATRTYHHDLRGMDRVPLVGKGGAERLFWLRWSPRALNIVSGIQMRAILVKQRQDIGTSAPRRPANFPRTLHGLRATPGPGTCSFSQRCNWGRLRGARESFFPAKDKKKKRKGTK